MNYKTKVIPLILSALPLLSMQLYAKEVLTFEPVAQDMTPIIRSALKNVKDKDLKIVFKKGTYKFLPEYASSEYRRITNHGNGLKKIAFSLDGFDSVEIEGAGSEFIFHGQIAPFEFYNNKSVKVSNITIDWDIPFTFVAEVLAVNEKQGYRDVKPVKGDHQWDLKGGKIRFPNVDGFSYDYLGSTLAWDKNEKRVVHGGIDSKSKSDNVEDLGNGVLRIHEKLKNHPPIGSLTSSKGDRETHRYAPAFQVKNSKNIVFDNVVIHHALGMGFLFEKSEDIQILNSGVYLRDGSERLISTTADATHFANCKGDILIENSRFENMLDDGANVHGTYTIVDKIIDSHTVLVKFGHFEQTGFEFTGQGDEIWFIHQPNTKRENINIVESVNIINENYTQIKFKDSLPKQLTKGDLLENKTWNPTFTMRKTIIKNHRARNVVLKTPLKTVIEDNFFSSMMSSILFRGETFFWYESGAVEDVLIRNNTFDYVAYAGKPHAVLNITPRLSTSFNQDEIYDRNIRFENNTINSFGNRIVWADRVGGLTVSGNTINRNINQPVLHPDSPLFEFVNSENIELKNNTYNGKVQRVLIVDDSSKGTLIDDGSIK